MTNSKYHFFWNGPLSQWYPSYFTIDGVQYNSTEQYMMAQKALLFNDTNSHKLIMVSKSPKNIKELGRAVKNFIKEEWILTAKDIVYAGNSAKFQQSNFLKEQLIKTAPKILVEASPYDIVWGVGLHENDVLINNPKNWRGTNWLGEVLTKLRNDLIN